MINMAKNVGRLVRGKIFAAERDRSEADIADYLYEREEIALRSLQSNLRNLKKYQMESEPPRRA